MQAIESRRQSQRSDRSVSATNDNLSGFGLDTDLRIQ